MGLTGEVAVVGAGPYGLAIAQQLLAARVDAHIFGRPMSFWREHMPCGMCLRSSWQASSIGASQGPLTLSAYERERGERIARPVPLDDFLAYADWFQRKAVPCIDAREITEIARHDGGFRLQLSDGAAMETRQVVVAAGLARFPARPAVFDQVGPDLASHSADHRDLGIFKGQRVVVVGGGQSALESAALLHESGAEVEVIARTPALRWLSRSARLHRLPQPVQNALYAPTDVGPPGLSLLVATPELFRRLPLRLQGRIAYRSIRPAGAGWLVPRLSGVPMTTGRSIVSAQPVGDGLRLGLDDGSERLADHALLCTGYRVDLQRYCFLSPDLKRSIRAVDGYPTLYDGFESSVPGLYFAGASAARSYGPVVRFVSGSWFTAPVLASRVLARSRSRR